MSVSLAKSNKLIKVLSFVFISLFCSLSMWAEPYKHEVKKGETYYGISRSYGITVDQLLKANNLTSSDVLKVGQILIIPGKSAPAETVKTDSGSKAVDSPKITTGSTSGYDTYIVQKGDTLWHIASVNGLKVDELKRINGMSGDVSIKIGQELKIPSKKVENPAVNVSLPDLPSSDPRKYSEKTGDSSLTWPVKKPTVTYINGKVSGVHLTAQKNESVTSIRSGTVMYVGNYRGYGQVVFIQSPSDYIYAYSGLGTIKVKKGDYVVFGDVIGTAGTDSIKGTSQISLMVFQKSNPIDPAKAPRG